MNLPIDTFKAKRGRRKQSDHAQNHCCYCKRKFLTGDKIIQLPCKHLCHSHENYKWIYNEKCNICIISVKRYFPIINDIKELPSYLESRESTLNNSGIVADYCKYTKERNILEMIVDP